LSGYKWFIFIGNVKEQKIASPEKSIVLQSYVLNFHLSYYNHFPLIDTYLEGGEGVDTVYHKKKNYFTGIILRPRRIVGF